MTTPIFTLTKFDTIQDKEKFARQFKIFVLSGFARSKFHKAFYTRLSMCFGFIAQYNQDGFYECWFKSDNDKREFIRAVLIWGCYGSPEYTYSDVEKYLQSWLKAQLEKG